MIRIPITAVGAERLREELDRLRSVERPRVIQAIAEARAHGDLSENAEYHAAKEEQSFLEGRIAELNVVLSEAQVIDPTKLNVKGKVVFGATVELLDQDSDAKVVYKIVGELEADIQRGEVSINSPIARALIGKQDGAEVEVTAPGGVRYYEILNIRYI
ncbi:MAG TPA: transcription elongation factor GreA [Acidiferrobacteraceae bacterium]|nr:transcription elongation factor GreA [Acidiferrobacteraceae bacterium]